MLTCADLVYKYKLLYSKAPASGRSALSADISVYYKPYESNGEAWRITFDRLLWALIIFQLFMTGIFTLSAPKSPIIPALMLPLIAYTLWWSYRMFTDFGPLSKYLALSSICEVQRGEGADAAAGLTGEDGVPRSQRLVLLAAGHNWNMHSQGAALSVSDATPSMTRRYTSLRPTSGPITRSRPCRAFTMAF